MLNLIRKVNSTFQRNHRGTIFSFIMFVIGWVVGVKINIIVGAYLLSIAVPLFVYWILSEDFIHNRVILIFKRFPSKANILYISLTFVLIIASEIIIRVPEWSNVISFLAPESDSYIIQTISHSDEQYNLLVEFGVRLPKTYDINTVTESIAMETSNNWTDTIEKWWDLPHLKNKSENAVYPFDSVIYVKNFGNAWTNKPPFSGGDNWIKMSAITTFEDIQHPPLYVLAFKGVPISTGLSLYMLFKSNKPISINKVRFNDSNFNVVGTKLIQFYR